MCKRRLFLALWLVACSLAPLAAADFLLFFEAQGIGGYSFRLGEGIFHSQNELETMQKSSLGFDYVQRFSIAKRDVAVLSVQARLALDILSEQSRLTYGVAKKTAPVLQIYNAFLKFKFRPFDAWIGHNRPHFGLASQFDQHAHLLQPLVMSGFSFDRDWGVGLERDTASGDFGISLTSGSGMSLRLRRNWLLAARLAEGILERDNFNIGLSFGFGKVLDVMGNYLLSDTLVPIRMAELDMTWLYDNWENRLEIALGDRILGPVAAVLWRVGLNLLRENRLKLEVQPALLVDKGRRNLNFSAGLTFLANADWTLRAMYLYDRRFRDSQLVFQIYFYKGLAI
jgi:hypothetical protein